MWLMIAYHCLIFKWNLNWCICAYFSYSMPDGLWYTSSLLIFPPHDKCIYVYFLFTPPPPWHGGGEYWEVCRKMLLFSGCFLTTFFYHTTSYLYYFSFCPTHPTDMEGESIERCAEKYLIFRDAFSLLNLYITLIHDSF